jgi:HTH-type transcriptional regulator/antitoxin HigA
LYGGLDNIKKLLYIWNIKFCAMKFKLIKTEEDYEFALQRLEAVFDAKPGTDAADEL